MDGRQIEKLGRSPLRFLNSSWQLRRLGRGYLCALFLVAFCTTMPEAVASSRTQGAPSAGSSTVLNQSSTTLVGRVVDSQAAPVPGAVVVTPLGGQALSDALGDFVLPLAYPPLADGTRLVATAVLQGINAVGNKYQSGLVASGRSQVGDVVVIQAAPCELAWIPTFGGTPGVNGDVYALTVFDDGSGSGPALYAGGDFTLAGGVPANRIA